MPWFALTGRSNEPVCFTWDDDCVTVTLYCGMAVQRWSQRALDSQEVVQWYCNFSMGGFTSSPKVH
ncbi:hypothetical protein ASC87_19790 [Rhizobacter sp. Root1221]|nr:hypothetical protein ASC87_19790 [Rhizobacter sp. Root1221]